MINKPGTPVAYLQIGDTQKMVEKHNLCHFFGAKDWIKVPDFIYQETFEHLVLDPSAHQAGEHYLVMPILTPGKHGKTPPLLSAEAYLATVHQVQKIHWLMLTANERNILRARYQDAFLGTENEVAKITITLQRSIAQEIAHFYQEDLVTSGHQAALSASVAN